VGGSTDLIALLNVCIGMYAWLVAVFPAPQRRITKMMKSRESRVNAKKIRQKRTNATQENNSARPLRLAQPGEGVLTAVCKYDDSRYLLRKKKKINYLS
jgi:hypothetical protein